MSGFYRRRGKRIVDVVGAGTAIIVLSPLLLGTAIAVRWKLGTPILFVQERGGRDGLTFVLIKFRTLSDARDASGNLLPDADRVSAFGDRLRSLSLDELPELFNVLKGDMSLVGPRPLLTAYLTRYSEEQRRRHDVRPGLTGWAQVNGRNLLDWDAKFTMDTWYVDHVSFGLDVRILWRTLSTVVGGTGVSSNGHVTMNEFRGSDEPEPPPP